MIVAVVGSRKILDANLVSESIKNSKFPVTKIVSGGAIGVDSLAENYAIRNDIKFEKFPPNPALGFPQALFARNMDMAKSCESCILIWDEKSTGTMHMLSCIKKLGKSWVLFNAKGEELERNDNRR